MGIKNPKRVAFTFDDLNIRTLTPEEQEAMKSGKGLVSVSVRPSQEAAYAARRRLASHDRCPCCYQEIPEDWRK